MLTVGEYLCDRIKALGVDQVFGVPGDYVLEFMDVMLSSPLELVCTCNELNAGYAADAYARIKGLGAVCITYVVGGLSLVNAVVGAYAERVPLIVLVVRPIDRSDKEICFYTTQRAITICNCRSWKKPPSRL